MNGRLFILIPIILSVLMFAPSVPKAHAATGLVCVTNNTNNACPASPFTLGPYTVGSKFSVGIFIHNSDAMGGYDIYVKADPAVLNPTGASLGPLIANPSLTSICINGVATTGSCTVGTANSPGVVEVTTIESSGGNECAGLSPCSGMAFFINYTVVGAAATTSLSFPTAPGCSVSSVSTPANVCVQVADSLGNTLSESIQGATVIQGASPDFTITAFPSSQMIAAGLIAVSNVTIASLNRDNGTVVFSTTIPPGCLGCPTWQVNPPTLLLPPGGSNLTSLIFFTNSTTPPGSWNVTVGATLRGVSHSVTVNFKIIASAPPNFSLAAVPSSLLVASGFSNSSKIFVGSLNGFSGTVNLSFHVFPINSGTIVTLFPGSVSLSAGVVAMSTLTFQSSQPGNYNVNITATSGTISHFVLVTAKVVSVSPAPDFSMSASPASPIVHAGSSNSSTITFASVNGFSGTINVTFASFLCSGCSLFWQNSVILQSGGTGTAVVTLSTSSSTPTGPVGITMVGTSGTISHQVTIGFTVVSAGPPPDFSISANPTSLTVLTGSSNSSTITLTSINGFSGLVFISTSSPPSCTQSPCLTWFLTASSVTLSSGGNANLGLIIDGGQQATSGTITVTASGGGITRQTTVSYQVKAPPPDFNLNAFPSNITVSAGQEAYSNIQVSPLIFGSGNTFTVTLTATVHPAPGLTLALNPTSVTVGPFTSYSTLEINTTSATTPTIYTIVVTGQSSQFIHTVTITVKVLPPPSITLTPTSGPTGTKVLVQGFNFPVQYSSTEILVTFDDQLLGFTFTSTTSFNFTFNVPVAQVGMHLVKASIPFSGPNGQLLFATASFQVTPTPAPSSLAVSIDVGTIYFPGDTAKAFILVTQNGQPASPTDLQLTVTLLEANGSSIVLQTTKLSTGVYTVVYNIPITIKGGVAPLGTFAIVASAHSASVGDSTALASFEVKPTWLASNGKTLVTGVTLVGLAGVVGVAWKKGYFRKKEDELFPAA